ncbi:MAG: CDP-alcohol phosphatidyltransferase family protein [Gammaproteobacteria bacterium]|nr:MAG: CDP-alcohol phosphatidyltransferase family protein [Gammaproteobacteria bacterium]
MVGDSWTHKIARVCILPLVNSPITPNHLTTIRLITGVAACGLFAIGTTEWNLYGGCLWILSAFMDRADGELARVSGKTSSWGHKYDYFSDVFVTALFFFSIGIGLRDSTLFNINLGLWTIVMGVTASAGVIAAEILAEIIDQSQKDTGDKAYAGFAGFDFDDVLYLFAPVVWLNLHLPFLIGASVGAPIFALLTWYQCKRL